MNSEGGVGSPECLSGRGSAKPTRVIVTVTVSVTLLRRFHLFDSSSPLSALRSPKIRYVSFNYSEFTSIRKVRLGVASVPTLTLRQLEMVME
jgi:hypothetical protein